MYNQLDYNTNTVLDILRLGTETYSDKTLLRRRIDGTWKDWSWNRIKTEVDCLALFLIDFGLKSGEIVSIYSENRPEWVVSDFGSLSCGAVNAAIYPTNSAKEASYIINDSRSKVCFCAGKFQVDNLLAEKGKMPSLDLIVVLMISSMTIRWS
jgi:long-chain acyl-CoA synthetase